MKTLIKRLLGITRLERELSTLRDERDAAEAMVCYLRKLMDERYETEWKITKDGKRRYRKIATKILVNAWHTESESIKDMETVILPPPMPYEPTEQDYANGVTDDRGELLIGDEEAYAEECRLESLRKD